jgi:hypothetical protein
VYHERATDSDRPGKLYPTGNVSLAELLRRYDLAYPAHTIMPRETVIAAYHEASSAMNAVHV